jgi:hypothetical protein
MRAATRVHSVGPGPGYDGRRMFRPQHAVLAVPPRNAGVESDRAVQRLRPDRRRRRRGRRRMKLAARPGAAGIRAKTKQCPIKIARLCPERIAAEFKIVFDRPACHAVCTEHLTAPVRRDRAMPPSGARHRALVHEMQTTGLSPMIGKARSTHFIVSVALVGLAILALLQARPFLAYRRLDDLEWRRAASPQQLRQTAHSALGLWVGDPHDAFLLLQQYGDRSSIPHLRRALARVPRFSDGSVPCTWIHGRDALTRITSNARATPRPSATAGGVPAPRRRRRR